MPARFVTISLVPKRAVVPKRAATAGSVHRVTGSIFMGSGGGSDPLLTSPATAESVCYCYCAEQPSSSPSVIFFGCLLLMSAFFSGACC